MSTPCKHCGTSGSHYCPADVEMGVPAEEAPEPKLEGAAQAQIVFADAPYPWRLGEAGKNGAQWIVSDDGVVQACAHDLVAAEAIVRHVNAYRPLLEVLRTVEHIDFEECAHDGDEINAVVRAAIDKVGSADPEPPPAPIRYAPPVPLSLPAGMEYHNNGMTDLWIGPVGEPRANGLRLRPNELFRFDSDFTGQVIQELAPIEECGHAGGLTEWWCTRPKGHAEKCGEVRPTADSD